MGSSLKLVLMASIAAAAGLIAAGVLGVAGASEITTNPTTTVTTTATVTSAAAATTLSTMPPRAVSVEGVARESIESNANAATATAVYRHGMADAIVDGQSKAQYLASKAGATVGGVQSIGEEGGYIECSEEYTGEQPDFGSGNRVGSIVAAPVSAPAIRRPVHVTKPSHAPAKHGKHQTGKKASVDGGQCTLYAQVALVYALS